MLARHPACKPKNLGATPRLRPKPDLSTPEAGISVLLLILLSALLSAACGLVTENDPAHGEIEFTNATDVSVAVLITNLDQPLDAFFDRTPYLPGVYEKGTTWTHGVYERTEVRWENDEQSRYCQDFVRYWFVTPNDPDYSPTGLGDPSNLLDADDVTVVSILDSPCWDERDDFTITRDDPVVTD